MEPSERKSCRSIKKSGFIDRANTLCFYKLIFILKFLQHLNQFMEFNAIVNEIGNGNRVKIRVIEHSPSCRLITGYVSRIDADAKTVDLCPYVIFNFHTSEDGLSPVSPPDVDGAPDCEASYEGLLLESENPHSIHITTSLLEHTYRVFAVAREKRLKNVDALDQYIKCAENL